MCIRDRVPYAPGPYPLPAHPPIAPHANLGAAPEAEPPPASSAPLAPPTPSDVAQPSKPARPTVVATVHDDDLLTDEDLDSSDLDSGDLVSRDLVSGDHDILDVQHGEEQPTQQAKTPKRARSSSVFSDQISNDPDEDAEQSRIATTEPVAAPTSWQPGDRLDARQNDRKPTTAIKAQRFWQTIAAALDADSHFDDDARSRMADGRAPRRRNPRTGSTETAALVGLRSAASADEVRMYWPCLLYTSPSPRDATLSRMPSSA